VEEIDGGAALERTIGLRRDERDRLDQQGYLMPIFSDRGIEVVQDGYEIFGVEFAALDEHALSCAEIDFRLVDL
jgi:hypothetical protein